jgi:hypothetical protein
MTAVTGVLPYYIEGNKVHPEVIGPSGEVSVRLLSCRHWNGIPMRDSQFADMPRHPCRHHCHGRRTLEISSCPMGRIMYDYLRTGCPERNCGAITDQSGSRQEGFYGVPGGSDLTGRVGGYQQQDDGSGVIRCSSGGQPSLDQSDSLEPGYVGVPTGGNVVYQNFR